MDRKVVRLTSSDGFLSGPFCLTNFPISPVSLFSSSELSIWISGMSLKRLSGNCPKFSLRVISSGTCALISCLRALFALLLLGSILMNPGLPFFPLTQTVFLRGGIDSFWSSSSALAILGSRKADRRNFRASFPRYPRLWVRICLNIDPAGRDLV